MKQLTYSVKNYLWGTHGDDSVIRKFIGVHSDEDTTPYAELWIGTHPNGPSSLSSTGTSLEDYLSKPLRFLFKILDVEKPLSIQIHPNRELASALHEKFPLVYCDPLDKPELLIALSPFKCMAGFRDLAETLEFLSHIPLLSNFISSPSLSSTQLLFLRLFSIPVPLLEQIISFLSSLSSFPSSFFSSALSLSLSLSKLYPTDPTILSPFFLQLYNLSTGDSFFVPPNCIHAYIKGTAIEIMNNSDNVIRAGLTPKHVDLELISQILTRSSEVKPHFDLQSKVSPYVTCYSPPSGYSFFQSYLIDLPCGQSCRFSLSSFVHKTKILFVLSGSAVVNGSDATVGDAFVFLDDVVDVGIAEQGFKCVVVVEQ
ncbi:hypothetical protein RCL1_008456 [Eukaryota sp. TZLM3-RCL]